MVVTTQASGARSSGPSVKCWTKSTFRNHGMLMLAVLTETPVRLAVAISSPGRGSAANLHLARTVPTLAVWLVSEGLLIKWMRTPATMEPLSLMSARIP